MTPILASRVLLGLLLLNEAIVALRSRPGEIQALAVPLPTRLATILLLAPFFWALPLPAWLGWMLVSVQAAGLLLEVTSELQLARASSFGVTSDAASSPQQRGAYRWLENPIYVGIFVQLAAWAVWMPLALIPVALSLPVLRKMVRNERQFLASRHRVAHRGVDSFLWN